MSVCSEIQQLYSRENGYKKKSLQQTEIILYLTLNIKHVLSKTIKLFSVIMAIYSISIYCTEVYYQVVVCYINKDQFYLTENFNLIEFPPLRCYQENPSMQKVNPFVMRYIYYTKPPNIMFGLIMQRKMTEFTFFKLWP